MSFKGDRIEQNAGKSGAFSLVRILRMYTREGLHKWGAAAHRGVRLPSVGGLAEDQVEPATCWAARLRVPDKEGRRMRC